MIAKVIVWDETRSRAIEKMIHVLKEAVVFGVHTNIPYLIEILSHEEFVNATMTTHDAYEHKGPAAAVPLQGQLMAGTRSTAVPQSSRRPQ